MTNNIFHITNKGIEKKKIFLSEKDYLRFVHNLSDFNSITNATQSYYRRRRNTLTDVRRPSRQLIGMLCWSLLPNHPHVMLINKINNGMSLFAKKIIGGYTKYFNEQHQRSGVLFQGRSKIIPIKNENHFWHLPFYIHTNPLDLYQKDWREKGIKNLKKAMRFLENYKWSSYQDIIGKENFGEVINKELFYKLFDTSPEKHKKDLENWLRDYPGKMEMEEFKF